MFFIDKREEIEENIIAQPTRYRDIGVIDIS